MFAPVSLTAAARRRALVVAVVCLAATACTAPQRSADYRVDHAIRVTSETVSLSLPVPGDGRLSGEEAANFERFIADYHARGRRALRIEGATAGADRLAAMLIKSGVREKEIIIAGGSGGGAITLSFVAAKVKVSECGQFTSKTTPNWTNRRHANFGCATQRNLGLMIHDPNDAKAAPPAGEADGNVARRLIELYRNPAPGN